MCKMIQFTEVFCFQGVASEKFFDLGLDVRRFVGTAVRRNVRELVTCVAAYCDCNTRSIR